MSNLNFPNIAQDGTDQTGITPPAGSTGIRGWLSGLYGLFNTGAARTRITDGTNNAAIPTSAPASDTGQAALAVRVISQLGVAGSGPLASGTNLIGRVQIADSNANSLTQQYSSLRVTPEPSGLFFDPLESLDPNRWTTAGTAPVFTNGSLVMASSTTAAATSQIISVPTFIQSPSSFLQLAFAARLDPAGAAVTQAHRFFGQGTAPAIPSTTSAATKLTDAVGWEIDTDGKLYACIYAGGVRAFSADLSATGTNVQKLDGAYHRYIVQVRSDRIYWFIDDINTQIASALYITPNTQQLPLRIHQINNVTTQTTAPSLTVQSNSVVDTGHNNQQISDGFYPWRKATVSGSGQAAIGYADSSQLVYGNISLATVTQTALIAAQGAGIRTYITSLVISNASTTAVQVTIQDGNTTLMSVYVAASGGGASVPLPASLRGSVNTALNVTLSGATTGNVLVHASGFKASY